jgi:membrane associated rhomboid family serine protease
MSQFQFTRFNYLPTVIKNLLILNGLVFLAQITIPVVDEHIGLYLFNPEHFQPYQIVSHMFAHGNFLHIFLNMFALWMFGAVLENVWGPKRFLIFYLICGFGAAALHTIANYVEYTQAIKHLTTEQIHLIKTASAEYLNENVALNAYMEKAYYAQNSPAVGASGAVFGVLAAFGMLFPNTMIYIYAILPLKAKYFVIIYIALEIYAGFLNAPGDNVAHFAHLGGALFGFIMVKYWGANKTRFY